MPTITPTPEEEAQIDRLVAEYDPMKHPSTAGLMGCLAEGQQIEIVTYMAGEMQRRVNIALAMKAVLDSCEQNPQGQEYRTLLRSFDEAQVEASLYPPPSPDKERFDAFMTLFESPDWNDSIEAKFETLMSGPANGLLGIEERVRRLDRLVTV
jgi:hypothetical protein